MKPARAASAMIVASCRALVGARGLKLLSSVPCLHDIWSRPCGGAWIETIMLTGGRKGEIVAPLWGRVD